MEKMSTVRAEFDCRWKVCRKQVVTEHCSVQELPHTMKLQMQRQWVSNPAELKKHIYTYS